MSRSRNDNELNFERLKIQISRELYNHEVESLAWLSEEQLPDLEGDPQENASCLIQTLKEKCKIRPDLGDYRYLKRLLMSIHRLRLANLIPELEVTSTADNNNDISELRILLYEVTSRLTDGQVKEIRTLSGLSEKEKAKSAICVCAKLVEKYGGVGHVADKMFDMLTHINRKDLAEILDAHMSAAEETKSKEKQTKPKNGFNFPMPKELRLNGLLLGIVKALSDEEFEQLKFTCMGEEGIGEAELDVIKKPLKFFSRLRERMMISDDNMLLLQYMLNEIGREDLNDRVTEYIGKRDDVLHIYRPKKDENANEAGYGHYQFHVKGDLESFWRGDMEELRTYIASLLTLKPEVIFLVGVDDRGSLILTFRIHKVYGDTLEKNLEQNLDKFAKYNVDGFHIGISDPLDLTNFTMSRRKHKIDKTETEGKQKSLKPLKEEPMQEKLEPDLKILPVGSSVLRLAQNSSPDSDTSSFDEFSKFKSGKHRKLIGAERIGMDLADEVGKLAAPSASLTSWLEPRTSSTPSASLIRSGKPGTSSTPSASLTTSGKPGTSSKSSGNLSVSLKERFSVGDLMDITEILLLQGGLILVLDLRSKDLKLFDLKGNLLQQSKPFIMGHYCCLAYLGGERVACLTVHRWLYIFNITSSDILTESECVVDEEYKSITALDSNTLAAACLREKRIDIISIKGKTLRSIAISEQVLRACLSQDGSLICIYSQDQDPSWSDVGEGILEIDLSNGKELLKRSDYERLTDVATTRDGQIIVCNYRGIDLLDAHGSLVRTLWSLPEQSPYKTRLSVYDDVMVCSTREQVYVFELTY